MGKLLQLFLLELLLTSIQLIILLGLQILFFSGLSSGTYTIYYRDANLCLNDETFTLTDPNESEWYCNINSIVSCFGVNDAQIQFNVDPILSGTPGLGNPYSTL